LQPDESCFETARYIAGKAVEKRFVMAKLPNLIPTGLSWFNLFLETMYLDPHLAQRLCDAYLSQMLPVARMYVEIGVDCILICSDWAYNRGPIVSPDLIRRFWIPQVRAVSDLCRQHGVYLMKHTDGNITAIAKDFFAMGIDAYQGIEGNAGMCLARIKEQYGQRITLMGNVDCGRILPFGSREEIERETRRAILEGAAGGGFILSSNNTIHSLIPAGNYRTMLEAARRYGGYPLLPG
jgi:uroporphyrinogen decarboxylase